jgi:hypothetical protein
MVPIVESATLKNPILTSPRGAANAVKDVVQRDKKLYRDNDGIIDPLPRTP